MKYEIGSKLIKKVHLRLLISLISVFIIISAYYYFEKEVESLRGAKRNELKVIAELKTDQIEKWQQEMISYPNIFSESPFFINGVENWIAGNSNRDSKDEIKKRISLMNIHSNYENIFIASSEGRLLVSLKDSLSSLDSVTITYIKGAIKENKAICTDFYYCPLHRKIHLDYICPIFNKNNKAIAVLVFRVNPDKELFSFIKEWPTSSATAEFYLVEKRNDRVVLLNELNHKKNSAFKIFFPLSHTDLPAIKAVNGKRGIYEGRDYNGREVVSYISSVEGTDWILIAMIDKKDIYHQLYYHEGVIIIFALFLVVLVAIGLNWYYHYRQRNIYKELLDKKEKLRESEDKFEKIFHNAPVIIGITDMETGVFIDINETAEKISGYKKEELMGLTTTDINWISIDERKELLRKIKAHGSVKGMETRHIGKNGNIIHCILSVEKILLNGKECMLSVLVDNTDRKRMEEELEKYRMHLEELVKNRTEALVESNKKLEAEISEKIKTEELLKVSLEKEIELNKLKTRFITNTSHEFRTPLTAILSSTELLQRYGAKWDQQKIGMHMDRIKNAVDYLSKLLADVLALNQNEEEKRLQNNAPVNCLNLCRQLVDECSANYSNGCVVTLNYLSSKEEYIFDEKQVGIIIRNLLSNACKFSASGSRVEMTVSEENGLLKFAVKDEGIGISENDISSIYDPFYRADNADDIRGNGTGLTIVKNAVDFQNGKIHVSSELGTGTTFIVDIPVNN